MNDDFDDDERDNRGSVDPTGYARTDAEFKSRRCKHCSGAGFALVFDFDYDGRSVIQVLDDRGNQRKRAARTYSYCVCLYGRWILENHKKSAKDVYGRMPDFAEIIGQPSFWLERDPTYVEATPAQIDHAGLRRMLSARINARSQ